MTQPRAVVSLLRTPSSRFSRESTIWRHFGLAARSRVLCCFIVHARFAPHPLSSIRELSMSIKVFRVLLLVHLAALFASVGVEWLPGAIPEALELTYEELPAPPLFSGNLVLLVMGFPLLFVWLGGLVGLFLLKRWGRGMSLYGTLLSLPLFVALGPTIASGWGASLTELAAMLWGAVLACAYFSPVAEAFTVKAKAGVP
jgi:hypothetical protein